MTMITEFADQLFTFMALKYDIIATNYPRDSSIPVEDQDWSASDEFTVDIGHAVMMLSYSYRSSFRKQFYTLSTYLRNNAKLYPLEFALVSYRSHSPLKILVTCALISEMYLFLLFESGSKNTIKDYIEPSVTCFNDIYKAVLSKIDDPILKWRDVKRVASVVASGYDVFEPLMETEHPSESKDFFESVACVMARRMPQGEVERRVEELNEQLRKHQNTSAAKQDTDEDLYTKVKCQSRRVLSKVAQSVAASGASSSKTSLSQGTRRKKASNKNVTFGACSSDVSLNPDINVAKKALKTPPKVAPSTIAHASKKVTTTTEIDKSQAKEETSSDLHGAVSQTASNISGLDGKGKAGLSKKTKRKKAKKLAAMKAAEHEADQLRQARDEELRDRLSSREANPKTGNDGECLEEFSNLTVDDSGAVDEVDEPEKSFKEYFV